VEESLKERKQHDVGDVEKLAVRIIGTNGGHVQQTVSRLHSEWTALDNKV